MPHINPELLKKRKGGKLVPATEPKAKIAKSPKKNASVAAVKSVKESKASPSKKASPTKKKKGGKAGDGDSGSKGITVLSEKTLFLGQKVAIPDYLLHSLFCFDGFLIIFLQIDRPDCILNEKLINVLHIFIPNIVLYAQ